MCNSDLILYFFQGLSLTALSEIIRADFEARQYYVTGRLTKAIYAGMYSHLLMGVVVILSCIRTM